MSSLRIGLAVVGAVVLLAILLHAVWTLRRNAPRQASNSELPSIEPVLQDVQDDFDTAHDAEPLSMAVPVAPKRAAMDPLIDVIATLCIDPALPSVAGEVAIAALPSSHRAGSKPLLIQGLNLATQVWETPHSGQRYGAFQSGVQLANRSGALNEIEYSEFVVKTQAFADAIGATPEFPEMLDEVARARELDQFASTHDAQLSFTIRTLHASWSPGYIHQNAARLGFVAGAIPGRMVLPASAAGAPPVLVLNFDPQAALADDPAQAAIRSIALHLDVPQVDRAEQAYARMRQAAVSLAKAMDGVVTDDHAQPLSPQTMQAIGTELESIYTTLEQRDLAAGSALARRLFS